MRLNKRNLFAVLASCFALMLAGGLVATGATGQGGAGGYDGGGYDYDGGYDQTTRVDDEGTPRGGVDSGAGGDRDGSGGAPMTGIVLGVLLLLALLGGGLLLKQRGARE